MNILFTIKANTFKKAADIEDFLKNNAISYTTRVEDKPSLGSGKRRRQAVGKDELAAVLQCIAVNPKWTQGEVARSTGVGISSVGRIALGTHALQKNSGGSNETSVQ